MIKLAHSVFALPFALMAAFMAGRNIEGLHRPYAGQVGLIVLCMVAGRSVAMTFNRLADAAIDARNPRTAARPLPAGKLSPGAAWAFLVAGAAAFALGCWLFERWYENPWPLRLCGPVLLALCGYSYTKRFTQLSHFYLGAAIAFSPAAAWIAVHPASLGWPAAVLMAAVAFWIAGFDIIYACQDIEADRGEGLHSLPARLGAGPALWVARGCHAATVLLLGSLAALAGLGWLYLAGVLIVGVLLAVENSLVRANDLSRINVAFFTINGVISLALGALAITDMLLGLPAVV